MIIGVPKEIKTHEHRVGMLPHSVQELVSRGHQVVVQSTAGEGVGINDNEYISAGAVIAATADEVFLRAELIVKVKEPQAQECLKLKKHHILFTFLHLAADPILALELLKTGVTGIAYETVTDAQGRLPLLAPMSAVAGRVVVQMAAHKLEKTQGGRGVLLGGITGVAPANVTVIGGGVVGWHAIQVAMGMGASVTVLDNSAARLTELLTQFGSSLIAELSSAATIEKHIVASDMVIGAVLVPGAAAPKLVSRAVISRMPPGTVVADVAIDQGGCFETSHPTNFLEPTYVLDGVIYQCITNLPSAVPRTSAFALNNATLPYIIELAEKGYRKACLENPSLLAGLNICDGVVTHEFVAKAIDQEYVPALSKLRI
jgi:alanine dehydrogenase